MDPVAVWTALGVVAALLAGGLAAWVAVGVTELARLRRENADLKEERTTNLIRLVEADRLLRQAEHDRRDAEQVGKNLRSLLEHHYGRDWKRVGPGGSHETPEHLGH